MGRPVEASIALTRTAGGQLSPIKVQLSIVHHVIVLGIDVNGGLLRRGGIVSLLRSIALLLLQMLLLVIHGVWVGAAAANVWLDDLP